MAAPTPAVGWDVATHVAHLAWTDEAATAAATDKEAWDALVLEALPTLSTRSTTGCRPAARSSPRRCCARWRAGRGRLAEVLRAYPEGQRIPWYGPPMSATSMATARFMETWAHSLDVYAALGIEPEVSDRVKHVAHLGVRTRDFAFAVHGEPAPPEEFVVSLTAPSGELWTWGPRGCGRRP